VVFLQKEWCLCKSLTIIPYTLIKSSETIVVSIKILNLDSLQQYYHLAHSTSPQLFHLRISSLMLPSVS